MEQPPVVEYGETIEIMGVKIPFVPTIITPNIERPMRRNRYETGECMTAQTLIKPGDRVLELGAGVGLVSTIASRVEGVQAILSIEGHPGLIPMIRETHRINGVTHVELRHGLAATVSSDAQPFYVRNDFWGSSMEPHSRPYKNVEHIPTFGLGDLIAEFDPTVIIADIEGGELDLFDHADLSGVRVIMIELHPKVYGPEGQNKILTTLEGKGLNTHPDHMKGTVWVMDRGVPNPGFVKTSPTLPKSDHDMDHTRCCIVTCVKNEGPFLLEWIAYHKSIGIDDFVFFSNDCDDGTDDLLDHLDALGVVTHLPNPVTVTTNKHHQPRAMTFSKAMPQVKAADYVIYIDVDEFITIRTGQGHIHDLLTAAGPFHVLTMSELNFSSNRIWQYQDKWITEQFVEHETPMPGHWQAHRGIKQIIHNMASIDRPSIHSPILKDGTQHDILWKNGSGH
ncbi:MAG: glycosyltransferase family 2 protein, partial [Pseudomonadota bacterium]